MSQMDYFWKQQFDLPSGLGCGFFSSTHLLSLGAILVLMVLILYGLLHSSRKIQDCFIRFFPWIMVFMELFKDCFLIIVGRFSIDYLPLHLCGLGLFVFLAYSVCSTDKWRSIWGEIAFCTIVPGSVSALLFPDWIAYYPVWNFMNLYSYIWHMNLVLYPLALLGAGRIRPSISNYYRNLVFLAVVVPPIMIFDKITGMNYFFMNWAPEGSPLAWLYRWFGSPGWLAAYALMAAGIIALWYGIYSLSIQILRHFNIGGYARERR